MPSWNLKDLLLALLLVAAAALGVLYFFEREAHHVTKSSFTSYKLAQSEALTARTVAYRKLEQDYAKLRASTVDSSTSNLERLRTLADSSKRTADRLQQLVNKTAARCSAPSTAGATGDSQTRTDPGVLLADMHRELEARAREVASYADRSRERHEACVKIADNEK